MAVNRVRLVAVALPLLYALTGSAMSGDAAAVSQASDLKASEVGTGILIERARDYTIMLESRHFVPEQGISPEVLARAEAGGASHVIIQFSDLPDRADISFLRSRGVALLDYLPNLAYFASVPAGELDRLTGFHGLRCVIPIQPDDKISSQLREHGASRYAWNEDGTVRIVAVVFRDVGIEQTCGTLEKYGRITAINEQDHTLELNISEDLIRVLACEEDVQWIEQAPPPKQQLLDDVRATVGADTVQAPPYNLNGSGVALGIWDSGSPASTHDDFAGRLTIPDSAATGIHATTVAGIMAGDGSRSEAWGGTPYQWRGISTAADIMAYDWPEMLAELRSETSEAIGTYGIISSSNSWGWYLCTYQCSYFGTYDSWSKVYDNIVLGSRGAPISVVFGVGNDQDCLDCQDSIPGFPYGTVPGPGATAKNTIAVGATNALDRTMTTFSSWGPVKDGRIKPDIVAPGCKPTGGVTGPVPPNDYDDPECGTSYATPVISGSLGILRQQFDLLGYTDISPHTFKAVLIQSAQDLGNPGPDYAFGHGHLQLKDAVDLVIANHPQNELIRVDSLMDAEVDTYYMDVESGVGSLRVTLVWDDYKGTPGSAKMLINDLDLLLQSPGEGWYYAYKLDPANPSAPATTGYNDLDNVEVVEVASPEAGRWTVRVQGTLVPEAPQAYTLVLPFEYPSADVRGPRALPPEYRMLSNTPDPFSEITLIRFDLPEPATVTMRIYDARGRSVRTLLDCAAKHPGRHVVSWDGIGDSGRIVSPGVYFCRMEAGSFRKTQRMVFLR
jgi:hypothetical protein